MKEGYSNKLLAVPISLREANQFVENFHRHNKPVQRNGGKFAIGVSDGSQLWGVAIVGRPRARLLQDGYTAEVLRVCTIDGCPKNCCSFLYARCWRAWQSMGGLRLITYLLASEEGSSLKAVKWQKTFECEPGDWSRDGREREWQPIYGQLKFRWETSSSS